MTEDLECKADGAVFGNPSVYRGEVVKACITGAVAAVSVIARQLRSASERDDYYKAVRREAAIREDSEYLKPSKLL